MSGLKRGRSHVLVAVFLLGAFVLLSCQPAQPVATPKPAEKAAATPAKPAETPVAAATKPAATAKPAEKAAEKPVRGGTLRISHYSDLETLDAQMTAPLGVLSSMYDMLIEPDVDGNLTKEGLFQDWTVSGDGKSITFKLRGGVKFHDGTDLDAAAVKWNIERMKDPAAKTLFTSRYASVASVEVVDSLTVRFNLKQPDPLLISGMSTPAGMMVSPAAAQKLGQDFGRKPVSSAPFQLVEWVPTDHITLKRFEGYWGKDKNGVQLPYLDQVVFKILPDPTVAFANLRTGQVDALIPPTSGLPPEQLPVLKGDANLTYLLRPVSNAAGVFLNTKRPPFDNKALRQAVALALDREGIAARLGEQGALTASILHPSTWAYDGKAGMYPARDLAKAKAKMAEAGYPSGLKVKFSAWNTPTYLLDAQVIKANLAEIGIDVEIQVLALAVVQSTVLTVGGDYQISEVGTVFGLPDPGYLFGLMFHSRASRNFFGPYGNPQVDQLLDKAGISYDQKERTSLYREAAQIMADDVPFIPLYMSNRIVAMNKKVRGFALAAGEVPGFGRTWLAQ